MSNLQRISVAVDYCNNEINAYVEIGEDFHRNACLFIPAGFTVREFLDVVNEQTGGEKMHDIPQELQVFDGEYYVQCDHCRTFLDIYADPYLTFDDVTCGKCLAQGTNVDGLSGDCYDYNFLNPHGNGLDPQITKYLLDGLNKDADDWCVIGSGKHRLDSFDDSDYSHVIFSLDYVCISKSQLKKRLIEIYDQLSFPDHILAITDKCTTFYHKFKIVCKEADREIITKTIEELTGI